MGDGMPHYINPLSEKQTSLEEEGYICNFEMMEGGLKCMDTGEVFQPEDIKEADFFRFEGISDPEDMSILYAIETNNGCKGVAVNSYGTYADDEMAEFMSKVKKRSAKDQGL